jgi:hypothetical protein
VLAFGKTDFNLKTVTEKIKPVLPVHSSQPKFLSDRENHIKEKLRIAQGLEGKAEW